MKSFAGLVAEISDIIGGNDGLDIGGESPSARPQIERVMSELHFDAGIYQITEVIPVFEVSRAAVDLVHDDAIRRSAAKELEHFIEAFPAAFGGGLLFFKPARNGNAPRSRVPLDGGALFLGRNTLRLLTGRRDANIPEELMHGIAKEMMNKPTEPTLAYAW